MSIQKDPKGAKTLAAVIGRRLRATRRGAGLSQADAADAIGHRGVTQISLAEDGKRTPPLLDLIKLADLYCVPLDFIVGRIDDPIAEAEEHHGGLVVRAVSNAIAGCVDTFTRAISEHVAVVLSGQREDREDLMCAINAGEAVAGALARIRELNPEYEDIRGCSKMEMEVKSLSDLGAKMSSRVRREREQKAMIDTAIHLDRVEASIKQFTLEFQGTE